MGVDSRDALRRPSLLKVTAGGIGVSQGFEIEHQPVSGVQLTIAYGTAASSQILSQISEAGEGSHSQGTLQNIVQVYRDIASFF